MCYSTHFSDNGGLVSIGLLAQRVVADIQIARSLAALDPTGVRPLVERAGRVDE